MSETSTLSLACVWTFAGVMLFCTMALVSSSEVEGVVKNPHTSMSMAASTVVPEATLEPMHTATNTPVTISSSGQTDQYETGRIVEILSTSELEPETTWDPPHSPMHGVSLSALPLEFSMISSDTIARVKLAKVEGIIYERQGSDAVKYYTPLIRYEFKVLEYLKGGEGTDRIWAIVYLNIGFESNIWDKPEARSRAVLSYYLNLRETRWDNHEAIVFLEDSKRYLPMTHRDDNYFLGFFFEDDEVYALSATRQWLPLVHYDGVSGASGTEVESQFLLQHPDGHVWGEMGYPENYAASGVSGASGAADNTTIGLSELRKLAAMSEEELAFRWGLKYGWVAMPALTTTATHNSVSLGWDLHVPKKSESNYIPFQTGYQILRKGPGDNEFKRIANLAADARSYTDTASLKPASTYAYILRMLTVIEHDVDVQVEATTAEMPTPAPANTPEPTPTATP